MSEQEYAPTTAAIQVYAIAHSALVDDVFPQDAGLAEVDSWLAAHDREVREACAKVADVAAHQFGMTIFNGFVDSPEAKEIAARIRALNKEAAMDSIWDSIGDADSEPITRKPTETEEER